MTSGPVPSVGAATLSVPSGRVTEMVPRDAPDHLLRLAMLFCGQCDMAEQFSLASS